MARIVRPEYIGFPTGIINYGMLRNSPPGEMKTFKLTEEERLAAIDKYGPILRPLNRRLKGRTAQ